MTPEFVPDDAEVVVDQPEFVPDDADVVVDEVAPAGAPTPMETEPIDAMPARDLAPLRTGYDTPQPTWSETRNAKLRLAAELAQRSDLKRSQKANEISKVLGGRYDATDANLDAFAKTAALASFDPEEWSKQNQELEKLIVARPDLGPMLIQASEEVGPLMKLWNKATDIFDDVTAPARQLPDSIKKGVKSVAGVVDQKALPDLANIPGLALRNLNDIINGKSLTAAEREARDAPKVVAQQVDASSEALAEKNGFTQAVMAFGYRVGESLDQSKETRLQAALRQARADGADTSEIEGQIRDLQSKLPGAYGDGAGLMRDLAIAAQGVGSSLAVLPDALEGRAKGATAGAMIAGIGVTLATRNPLAGRAAMAEGAALGARIGTALQTFQAATELETGDTYKQSADWVRPDGSKLTEDERYTASGVAGVAKGLIEVVEMDQLMQFHGGTLRSLFDKELRDQLVKPGFLRILGKGLSERGVLAAKESATEVIQEGLDQGVEHVSKVGAAEMVDHFLTTAEHPLFDTGRLVAAGEAGALGSFVPSLVTMPLTTGLAVRDASVELSDASKVAALQSMAENATVRAGADGFAAMVAETSTRSGEVIDSMHVDAGEIVRYFQADKKTPNEVDEEIRKLLGDEGVKRLHEAIASSGKLSMTAQEYLEKFGGSELGRAMVLHTTTQSEFSTPAQMDAGREAEIQAEVTKLIEEVTAKTQQGNEATSFADRIRQQLIDAGRSVREATVGAVLFKAFYNTRASEKNLDVEALFNEYRVEIGLAQTEDAAQHLTDRLEGKLAGQNGALDLTTRTYERFIDPVTQLRNRRGWDFSPRKPGTRVIAIATGDTKAINDAKKGGHDTANELFARAGRIIGSFDNEAMREGTKFYMHGNEADIEKVLAALHAESPAGIHFDAAIGDDTATAGKAVGDAIDQKQLKGPYKPRGQSDFDVESLSAETFTRPSTIPAMSPNMSPEMLAHTDSLSAEQHFNDVYLDDKIPGLLSKAGFDNAKPRRWVASIDLKGLAKVNERLSKDVGTLLLHAFGEAAKTVGGYAVDLAHLSGDEFAAKHDSKEELESFLDDLRAELSRVLVEVYAGDRLAGSLTPLFRAGIGERTYGNADRALNEAKRRETAPSDDGGVRDIAGFRDARETSDFRGEIQRAGDRQLGRRENSRRRSAAPSLRGQQEPVNTSFDFGAEFTPESMRAARAVVSRLKGKQALFGKAFLDAMEGLREMPRLEGFDRLLIQLANLGVKHPDLEFNPETERLEFAQVKTKSLKQQMKKGSISTGEGRAKMANLRRGALSPTRYDQDPVRQLPKKLMAAFNLGKRALSELGPDASRAAVDQWLYGLPIDDLPEGTEEVSAFNEGLKGGEPPRYVRGWRYGPVPDSGFSRNFRDDVRERGVSLMQIEGGGIDAGTFKMFNSDRPRYLVDGFLLSVSGSDGEPLIIGAQNIRKIDGRLSERNVFYQDPKDEARGFSNIPGLEEQERAYSIFLNPTADQSTIVHEAAHVFLDVLAHAAVQPDASPRTKEIFDGFLKWVGAESREAITREQHEKFARGFEAFLFEGKAPSRELGAVFGRFKLWLVSIYRTIRGLNVELNDEVRGLYARLLATDDEINKQLGKTGVLEMGPLTETQTEELEFATRKAALYAARDALKETESFWKEELSKQKALANTAYEALPARQAQRQLARIDLDRAAVEEAVGKAAAKKFRTVAEEGVLPDEAAYLMGYPTGPDMLKAVADLPEKKAWVDQTAEAATATLHPGPMEDRAELRKLVADGMHGFTERLLLERWPQLRAQMPIIKRAAATMAENRTIKSLNPNAALVAERAAARAKAVAGVKGETGKALEEARREMLNAQLYRELLNAEDEKERFLELADELASKASRQRFGKSAPEFRDASDHILGSLGLANLETSDYAAVVSAIAAMEVDAVSVGEWRDSLADLLQKGNWETLTVSEMRVVNDALLNIRAASRNRASLMLGKRSIDKAEVVDRLLSSISPRLEMKKGRASRSAMSLTEKIVDRAQEIDAFLLNPVDLVRDLSGDDLNSPWHEYLIAPMREAKQKESDLLKKTIEPVTKAMEAMPSSVRSTLSASIDGEKLFPGHIRDLVPRKRYELLMMALNAGNAGNLQRLLDGRNITPEQLKAALDLLTAEEIQWVQTVFDAAESLKAEAFAVEERDSGLRPKAVEATPQVLKNGILRGGYFPAVYDKSASQIGERQAAQSLSQLMDPSYTRGSTPHSHTKSRSEAVLGAAISLEPSVIYRHLAQVAHDIAFRETVKSVGSVILDSRIDAALKNYLGVKKAEQFLSWVKDVGSMRLAENDVGQLISWARSHLSVSALGWSLPTAIGDLANVPAAVFSTQLKSGSVLNGLLAFLDPSKDIYGKSLELSGEMRFMRDTTRKNFDKHLKAFTEGQSYILAPLRWVKEHAFDFMTIINKATATPIWWGAYEQAKNEFDGDKTTPEAEAYAVKFADDVLTRVFPSHSAVDQAAILRDRGFWGMTTMFYGYMSTMYRAQHNIINRPDGVWKKLGNLAGFYIAAGLFGELLMGRGPEGDDEKENQWKWAMRKLIAAPLSTVPLPFAAGVEAALLNKKPNAKTSPVMALVDTAARYGPQLFTDPDLSKKADAAWRLAGPAFGIPQRPMQSAKFVVDWASGETVPRGPLDVGSGLIYGERNNQAQNLLTGMSDAVNGPKN